VTLKAVPINGVVKPFEVSGVIGSSTPLTNGDDKLTLEYTSLRVINVENFAGQGSATDVRRVDLRSAIEGQLGSGHNSDTKKTLRNVGPSIGYKLRDASGQAVEYHNYMLPMELDGARMYLLGMRESPAEPFRYLRIPADDQDSLDGFTRMQSALASPTMRAAAIARYAAGAVEPNRPDLTEALTASAGRALDLFAGADLGSLPKPPPGAPEIKGGLQAVSAFLEANVPKAEQERAGDVLVRILNGTLFELLQLSREQAGLPPLERNESTQRFMTSAVIALSDAFLYPAPMAFELKDFTHVQASVFQVARAPGQTIVYLGCALLILGVFAMLYVRERRLWIWLAPRTDGANGAQATMALSSNRKTMEADQEFAELKTQLLKVSA
jgi:cytochrome c biogenesis protein